MLKRRARFGARQVGCLAVAVLTTIVLDASPVLAAPPVIQRAYVEKVTDGDTLKVRLLEQGGAVITVRLRGIDCPESYPNSKCRTDEKYGRKGCSWQVPRGKAASKRAAQLLKHQTVALECDGACTKGRYSRELRYVRMADARDFGLVMVAEGLCEDLSARYQHPRQSAYLAAQAAAQRTGLGIWLREDSSP